MADTTASIVGGFGHGTKTLGAFHKIGRPLPTIELFCGVYEIEPGIATGQLTLEGAALTNATASESDAAATTQALNALASVSLTPGSYVSAISPTSQAMNRAAPGVVDLKALAIDEIAYPHQRTVAYDASIGIVPVRFLGISNRVGTAGATLTPSVLLDAYEALCENMGCHLDAVCWLNTKQWADLIRYGFTSTGAVYGTEVGANKLLLGLFQEQFATNLLTRGYMTSWGPIHIFVDPDPNSFGVVSSNVIGCMFVPAIPGMNGFPLANEVAGRYADIQRKMPGGLPLSPAFIIGYRAEPTAAPKAFRNVVDGGGMRRYTRSGIPIDVLPRAYVGQNLAAIDVWSEVVTAELFDLAGIGVRSVQ